MIDLLCCGVHFQVAPDDAQTIKDLAYTSKLLAEKVLSVCVCVCHPSLWCSCHTW